MSVLCDVRTCRKEGIVHEFSDSHMVNKTLCLAHTATWKDDPDTHWDAENCRALPDSEAYSRWLGQQERMR